MGPRLRRLEPAPAAGVGRRGGLARPRATRGGSPRSGTAQHGSGGAVGAPMRRRRGRSLPDPSPAAPNRSGDGAPAPVHGRLGSHAPSVPNPKSVTKFGGVSTTLAALLLLGIAPTTPRRRALPASPNRPRLWQRTSDPGH